MNNSSVKNYQSIENIRKMYENAFNKSSSNIQISILSGGMKNAVYLIIDDDKKIVLKIAPKDETKMISADRNVIWWEAIMLKKMETIKFPAPRLLCYDDTKTICETPYLFMTFIEGKNYLDAKCTISSDKKFKIENQLGILSKKICSLHQDKFFLPSDPKRKFDNNYEFVSYLFQLLFKDARNINVNLDNNVYEMINTIIERNKDSLNNITNLCLCHTDIWDGNILINDDIVTGIVDFSDLYYCDELMTFYFHTIDGKTSDYFLKGFNKNNLNADEKIRIEIYRMYVILKMIIDCELKQYGRFDWMYNNLNNRINILKKTI